MKKISFLFCALMVILSARANYYVVGDFNGWDVSNAIELTTTDGTNYTVQLDTLRGGFKIISARDWDHSVFGASSSSVKLSVGETISIFLEEGDSYSNINVAGAYVNAVLSFSITNNTAQLTLVSGTSTYYIVGDFNNWDVSTAIEMTTTDGVHYYVHLDTLYGGFKITNARDWNHLNWGAYESENSFSYVYNGYDRYFGELKTNENWEEDPNYNILTDQGYSNVTLGLYINNSKYYLWFDKVTHTGMKFYDNNLQYQITSVSPAEVSIIDNSISSPTNLVIPNSVNYNGTDFTVTVIGNRAFFNCENLTSVVLPNNLTGIGASAFKGTGLTSITLPNSLVLIRESAFEGTGLSSVIIPENLEYICENAFANCNNLSLVIWNARKCVNLYYTDGYYQDLETGQYVMGNEYGWINSGESPFPTSVETFIFGDQVQTIPTGICNNLTAITSVSLPNTVTSIGACAFRFCSGLISFTMENGVQKIGGSAFYYCTNLPQIVLPNTVTKIGYSAFGYCRNLTTAILGNSVDTIGGSAFSSCERLISIELPTTVNYIGGSAFYNCTSMNKAIIRSTAELDPYCMLLLNPQIDTIIAPASIFDIDEQHRLDYVCTKRMKYVKANSGELTEDAFVVIRRSASTLEMLDVSATTNTTIADEAFSNMYRLIALGLPQGLDRISYKAVAECVRLQSIDIPAGITEIGDRAFEDCRSLTTITFGGQSGATADVALQTIGNWAFYNNHALQQLTIPAGVTTIGAGAFYGCTYLEDLAMPASLRNVGDNAFALCNHLTKMQVEATLPPQVAARTFFDVNRAIPVYVPDEAVNDYRTTQVWQEFFIRPISQAATGIGEVEQDGQEGTGMLPDGKFMQNGQLFIRKNGRVYDTQGRLIE